MKPYRVHLLFVVSFLASLYLTTLVTPTSTGLLKVAFGLAVTVEVGALFCLIGRWTRQKEITS